MLGILLLILKIIGILLLAILGLVLCVILIVLFVPIRYAADVSLLDKKLNGRVCIHWLLHLFQLRILFKDGHPAVRIALAGFSLKKKDKESKDSGAVSKKKQKSRKAKSRRSESKIQTPVEDEAMTEMDTDRELLESVVTDTGWKEEQETWTENGSSEEEDAALGSKPTLSERWQRFTRMVSGKISALVSAFEKIADKKRWLSALLDYLGRDPMRQSLSKVKLNLLRLLLHVLPRRGKAILRIGFDNPATTGQALGVLAMLYPRFRGNLTVTPYFDRKILEGEISCRGRIRIFTLLIIAVKTGFDKNIRTLIRKIRKGSI